MQNIILSIVVLIGLGTLLQAGGDISPITYYEVDDAQKAMEYATESVPYTPKSVVSVPSSSLPSTSIPSASAVVPAIIPPLTKSKEREPIVKNEVEPPASINTTTTINRGLPYIGIGGTIAQYDTNCKCSKSNISGTDKTGGFVVKAGYEFNQYIGIEARGLKTMIKEDGGEIEHMGILIKPSYPISEDTNIYGLVGWAKTTTSGGLRKTDVDGLAFGGGVDYSITQNVSLFVDYERLFQESGAPKLDAVSMGANYKF